tara:strand:+ start:1518 stop:2036 length:519 start_codon:yes stop_codon:yes gene_type:complete
MANYRSWMLAGYQQNDTNGRHGLQWMHTRGLGSHRYGNAWHNVDISSWSSVHQSYDSPLDNSQGRFYCRSKGVVFSTVTFMFTNPNNRDVHAHLHVNGTQYSLTNDHCGGGSSNGHTWNGMTTSLCFAVNEGDYITCRFTANSDAGFYLYGGNNNYNNWQVFYLPGAQNNQG